MGETKTSAPVVAIVAAYNEADRLGSVLDVLTSYPGFAQVIVVDDGSTDATASVARSYQVTVLEQPTNMGKGQAMDVGVHSSTAPIIFFCDADIKGLTHTAIDRILAPVLAGTTDMMIAMRNRKIYYLRFILNIIPLLGGERAITRELWERVPTEYKERFKIEAALNFYAKYYGNGFVYHVFSGLTQTVKEKKYGLWPGFKGRVRMFAEVISAQLRLQLHSVPPTVRSGRHAFWTALGSLGGVAVGGILFLAAHTGPARFIRTIFEEELAEDPSAPLVHFLLNLAGQMSIDTLRAGALILVVINCIVFLFASKNALNVLRVVLPRKRVQ